MPAERTTKLRQTTLDGKPVRPKAASSSSSSPTKSKRSSSERVFTDVLLTIKPEFAELISKREKNHEYRKYKLRPTVERLWLYETAPTYAITHVIHTTTPKVPGEVCDPSGVGNDDFDAGKKQSKFGYPVLGLWKLKTPLTSEKLKEKYKLSVPQGFCFANEQLVDGEKLNDMEKIF